MSAIHINLADHFAWAVFLQRTLSLCEGFAAEYRYVPSLVIAGVFFTLIRLLRERISIRWLGPTSAITSPNRRPMHLTIHSDSPAQRMTAHREAHTFNNQCSLIALSWLARCQIARGESDMAQTSQALARPIAAEIGPRSGPVIELGQFIQ